MYPDDRVYSREHEWLLREDDGDWLLGITEYAQSELGDVVFVELPKVGDRFEAHSEIGTVESVKAVSEIYTPIAGEVVEVNHKVIDSPELLNEDPHGDGWLVRLRPDDAEPPADLMNGDEYQEYVS
jgi:glycine cleavage system H protein